MPLTLDRHLIPTPEDSKARRAGCKLHEDGGVAWIARARGPSHEGVRENDRDADIAEVAEQLRQDNNALWPAGS